MKSSLWIVIVVVVGVVGFLMGYAVSGYTGNQQTGQAQAAEHGSGGGYGAPTPKAGTGGYGAPAPAPKPAAGGYGR